jgi:hypothetical protein
MWGISIHDRQLVLIAWILRSTPMRNVLLHMHIFHMPGCLYMNVISLIRAIGECKVESNWTCLVYTGQLT